MQQKYTAADVREKRISFKGLSEEQFLALQAHFHKLYPEDGYMDESYVGGNNHRFYPTGDPEDGVSGSQKRSYLRKVRKEFRATLEITYDEFEFGQSVVGETYVGEWHTGDVKSRVIFKPTSSDNSTYCYFINNVNAFKKELCCQRDDLTFRKATDEEAQQLSNLIAGAEQMEGLCQKYAAPTYGGQIADFPIEVVEKMLEHQVAQGNERDVSVFEKSSESGYHNKGFSWTESPEGSSFWRKVILEYNFGLFFEKYPKFDFEAAEKLQNFITSPRNKPKPKATFHFDEKLTTKSILLEAEELINGERAKDYGKVSDNFANIAIGWNVIAKGGIDARKVGHMMAWVKICRDLQNPKHDNLVDAAGYMGCIDKMSRE